MLYYGAATRRQRVNRLFVRAQAPDVALELLRGAIEGGLLRRHLLSTSLVSLLVGGINVMKVMNERGSTAPGSTPLVGWAWYVAVDEATLGNLHGTCILAARRRRARRGRAGLLRAR